MPMSTRRRPGPGFFPNCSAKLPPLHNIIYAPFDKPRKGDPSNTTRVYFRPKRRINPANIPRKNHVPTKCDEYYNLKKNLALAIRSCDYFQVLDQITDYKYLIDQLSKHVQHLLPVAIGTKVRTPSKAFIILYKFCKEKLNSAQIKILIDNRDSPYTRGIGFLYLRFIVCSELLVTWFLPYVNDKQVFCPTGFQEDRETMGEFVTKLMRESHFCELPLPQLPMHILRHFEEELEKKNPKKKKEQTQQSLQVGKMVRAKYWEDKKYYDATIDRILFNGDVLVTFTEYEVQEKVKARDIEFLPKNTYCRSRSRSRSKSRSRNRSRSRSRCKIKNEFYEKNDQYRSRDQSLDRSDQNQNENYYNSDVGHTRTFDKKDTQIVDLTESPPREDFVSTPIAIDPTDPASKLKVVYGLFSRK